MRSIIGLLWALGGAVAGFVAGAIVSTVISTVTHVSNREGAQGFYMIGLGLIGAVVGLIVALVLYARSAPPGQAAAYGGSGVLGVAAVVALVALGLWGYTNLREGPLEYSGAMASLELELRIPTAQLPSDASRSWINVEVQTANTRPEASVRWSTRRVEGAFTIVPAIQQPIYRSANRVIVVRLEGRQDEAFMPSMRRTPDPTADWIPAAESDAAQALGIDKTVDLTTATETDGAQTLTLTNRSRSPRPQSPTRPRRSAPAAAGTPLT